MFSELFTRRTANFGTLVRHLLVGTQTIGRNSAGNKLETLLALGDFCRLCVHAKA